MIRAARTGLSSRLRRRNEIVATAAVRWQEAFLPPRFRLCRAPVRRRAVPRIARPPHTVCRPFPSPNCLAFAEDRLDEAFIKSFAASCDRRTGAERPSKASTRRRRRKFARLRAKAKGRPILAPSSPGVFDPFQWSRPLVGGCVLSRAIISRKCRARLSRARPFRRRSMVCRPILLRSQDPACSAPSPI